MSKAGDRAAMAEGIETVQSELDDETEIDAAFYGRHQRWAKLFLQPIFKLLWPIDISGVENIPTSGPAVLCPNHLAAIDSFVLPASLERAVLYVGKAEYLDDWKTSWAFPALGMIPIDRRGGAHAKGALDLARSVLSGGGLFAIYPEGTRSRSGKLYRGHTGAARLAIDTGAPIIPVGLLGTSEIQPVDVALPRPFRRAEVRIGEPIDVERYRSRIGDHALYRQLTDEVMFEIQALTGQEYDPRYAKVAAREDAEAAVAVADVSTQPEPDRPPAEKIAVDLRSPAESVDEAEVPRRSSADVLVSRPLVTAS